MRTEYDGSLSAIGFDGRIEELAHASVSSFLPFSEAKFLTALGQVVDWLMGQDVMSLGLTVFGPVV